jgi:hypothetical protein
VSRKIKFRAWLNGRKMLITNYDFVNGFATGIGWDVQEGEDEVSWLTRDIEQFTGLRDKDGKEIYEGDIVDAWVDFGPGGEGLRIYPVTINPHGTSLEPWTFKEKGYLPEVIGNIHEDTRK